ncbi:signal peptidase I [Pseudonocardia nantongensis]|uniref:signal peptidase I n=1 Tax=Pseudonocardia nantongensis TaxID=1181885 RepID=UPI00397C59F0
MAFPELPDDRRARPRRYRGSDAPERPGRRRAPEDPAPAADTGADEQDWLLGAALRHGVPIGEEDPEAADPATAGVRTRRAADEFDGSGYEPGYAGRRGAEEHGASGRANGHGAGPVDEGDSLRARYAERLRDTYAYDAGGPDAAPRRRRARADDEGRSWPPPGRGARVDDAPPGVTGGRSGDPSRSPGPPPYGAPPPDGSRAGAEATGRHGAPEERGRHGRRAAPPRNGAPTGDTRFDRPPEHGPTSNDAAPNDAAPNGAAPNGAGPYGVDANGAGSYGVAPNGAGPNGAGPYGDPAAAPRRGRSRHSSEPVARRGPDGYSGPPAASPPPGPPPRPAGPPGQAGQPRGRPSSPAGYPPAPEGPPVRPGPTGAPRPGPAGGPDRPTEGTGAHRDGAPTRRRPDRAQARGPGGGPPPPAAPGAPTAPVRPDGDVRGRTAPPPPEDAAEAASIEPGGPAALDPTPRRRRRPARAEPGGAPGTDDAPATAEPSDPDGEPAADTDGPRVGKRSGPVGIAGKLAALTGRGGSGGSDGEKRQMSFWKELPLLIGVALVLTFLIQTFLAKVYVIPSGSMETTLHGCTGCNNDRVLVDKVTYNFSSIAPGDVVVFKGPDSWTSEEYSGEPSGNPLVRGLQTAGSLIGFAPPDEKDFVKRVIATGGQTVACCDALNQVMVDGQPLEEPYTYFEPEAGPARQIPFGPVKVPEGELWLMGDSRNNSADSRAAGHGPVPEENVIGKVRLIALPFDRFGWVSAIDPQTTASAAGIPGAPDGLPLALGMMGTLPLAATRRLTSRARAESERFLPATRPHNGWRRRA